MEKYSEVSNTDGLNPMGIEQASESLIGTLTVMTRLIAIPLFLMGIFKIFQATQDPERGDISSGFVFIVIAGILNFVTFVLPSPTDGGGAVAYIEHKTYTFDFLI